MRTSNCGRPDPSGSANRATSVPVRLPARPPPRPNWLSELKTRANPTRIAGSVLNRFNPHTQQVDNASRSKRGFVRKFSALLVTAGLVATLTACASTPGYAECGEYVSGDASSIIDVSGSVGSKPTVDFPTPIVTHNTEATQVIEGDGKRIEAGQPARVELSIYNGATGAEIQSTGFDGNGIITMAGESSLPSVGKALECSTVGSRIVVAASPADAHNDTAIAELNV